jgi:hypothetical protein
MKNQIKNLLVIAYASLGVSAQAALTLTNYQATVEAQSPRYYFTFDGGSFANVLTGSPILTPDNSVANQFTYDIFQNPSDSIYFAINGDIAYDGTESSDHVINGGGAATISSTNQGTITCLFRTVDPGPPSGATTGPGAKSVFYGGGANGTSNSLDLIFENANSTNNPNELTLNFGDSSTTVLSAANVVADTWYYFALTYNESVTNADGSPNTNKATWYLGRLDGAGTLLSGKTINVTNAVAGDGSTFYIGSHAGNTTFEKPGQGRVDEFATWNRQLNTNEIQAQFASLPNPKLPPVSAYQTVISNQSPAHYFQLAGNTVDSMNPSLALAVNSQSNYEITNAPLNTSVGYAYDYLLDQNGAVYFSLASDAIYTNINLLNGGGIYTGSPGGGKGSISGMFHPLPSTNNISGQKFIFDAGGSEAASNSFALFFESATGNNPYSLKCRFGDSSDVMIPATNVLSKWYYFAITYDETATNHQVLWWVGQPGGTLQSGFFSPTNGSLAGEGDIFYIGNSISDNTAFRNQSSSWTGNGQISQIAIWNQVLTTNQVVAQFNALTASPVLNIVRSGANVILSWPLSSNPAFVLQSTPNLSPATWSSAGTPFVIGTSNVVTNAISASSASFYRLIK